MCYIPKVHAFTAWKVLKQQLLLYCCLQVVCQAQATVVFLDGSYKPVRVPGHVKEAFSRLQAEYKSATSG